MFAMLNMDNDLIDIIFIVKSVVFLTYNINEDINLQGPQFSIIVPARVSSTHANVW